MARDLLGHPFEVTPNLPEGLDETTAAVRIDACSEAKLAASFLANPESNRRSDRRCLGMGKSVATIQKCH